MHQAVGFSNVLSLKMKTGKICFEKRCKFEFVEDRLILLHENDFKNILCNPVSPVPTGRAPISRSAPGKTKLPSMSEASIVHTAKNDLEILPFGSKCLFHSPVKTKTTLSGKLKTPAQTDRAAPRAPISPWVTWTSSRIRKTKEPRGWTTPRSNWDDTLEIVGLFHFLLGHRKIICAPFNRQTDPRRRGLSLRSHYVQYPNFDYSRGGDPSYHHSVVGGFPPHSPRSLQIGVSRATALHANSAGEDACLDASRMAPGSWNPAHDRVRCEKQLPIEGEALS